MVLSLGDLSPRAYLAGDLSPRGYSAMSADILAVCNSRRVGKVLLASSV